MIRPISITFLSGILALGSINCYAKNINLYDQPKADSKVVGTIDSDTGIIPIFTPKDSTWIKVADPRNGNVGWIKNSDIGTGNTKFTFSQQFITTGKGPGTYQVIQFGNPAQPMSSQQAEEMMKEFQARQQAIQQDTNRMIQDMYKNMDQQMAGFPVIMPVIVLPEQKATSPSTKAPATTTPQKK